MTDGRTTCPSCGGPKDRRAAQCRTCASANPTDRQRASGKTGPRPTANTAAETLAKALATAVRQPNGCLHVTAWTIRKDGYVRVKADGRSVMLHRLVAEETAGRQLVGEETVDHVCHNDSGCPGGYDCLHRRCIEPTHLEILPDKVSNWERGTQGVVGQRRAKTHCPQGHPYDEANTYVLPGRGYRACRACHAERQRERAARGA